jgi:SpoVK/Ycf46/Vps4 family AAA+-type ATPase
MDNQYLFDDRKNKWFKGKRGFFGRKVYVDRVPPGKYEVWWTDAYNGLKPRTRSEDSFQTVTGSCLAAYKEFQKFWTVRPKFEELGLSFKRGFFLWGPPGTGKTTIISRMADYVITELDGLVFYANSHLEDELSVFKKASLSHGSAPVLVIMEEFEESLQRMGSEKAILAYLDGEDQFNNVVFLATSNYPEKANQRFFNRPSRFDTILFVGPPERGFKYNYVYSKLKDEMIAHYIADNSPDFTIAHLKEVIVCYHCLGMSVDEALEKITKMKDEAPDSDNAPNNKRKFGFLQED